MDSVSVTEQTRLQIERAQRAAQEARERIQAARGGRLGSPADHGSASATAGWDDNRAMDFGGD